MEIAPVTIGHHPHPILPISGRSYHHHQWHAGQSVREVLIAHGFDQHQEIVISLNDRLLQVVEWDQLSPKPGDLINVQVAVSGGGGGSNPLKIIATIAVAAFAAWAAPGVAGALGIAEGATVFGISATTIIGGAISMVGNIVLGGLFKPQQPSLNKASGMRTGEATSPTYSLSGGSNSMRHYGPLPIVMGTHRFFPDYGARPYVEFAGEDQYLYQIFNFGLSALSLSDFKIGTTQLGYYDGLYTYWNDANGAIQAFPGNVDTTVGGEIRRGAGWVERTSSADTMRLGIDIEGGCYYADDNGLVSCLTEVEIWYQVSGSGNWQPANAGTVTTYGEAYWSRGYWHNVSGIMGSTTREWVQVSYGSTNPGDHANGEIGGTVGVSSGLGGWYFSPQPTIWRWRPYSEILVDGSNTALTEDAPARPYTTVFVPILTIYHGASQKPQRRTVFIDVPRGVYDVRCRLNSARRATGQEISDGDFRGGVNYSFTQLRSYQPDTATYPGQTRLGMVVKASGQLQGTVQQLSCLASAYCNVWNGSSFVWAVTSNPAWWFLDFAKGRYNSQGKLMYGVGLPDSQIDLDGIKAWGAFCNQEGLSFNAVIDSNQSCADVLTMIARCGLGSSSWASGKLGVVWDARNASPVAAFGMSNIIRGTFQVEYINENLADEIVVNYVDASRDWQSQQVRVMTPGTINPQRSTTVDLMGCTNAAMAGKFANVLAAQQFYRRRHITFECDFEGFVCQRGDVVLLSHDLTQWGYSGRAVEVVGNVLTIDRTVPRSGAEEYLMWRTPDGVLTTYSVEAGTGDSYTLTLSAAPTLQSGYAAVDHVWFFSPLPTPGKKVKIISVQPVSESRVRLVATDEDPAFYKAWDGMWTQAINPSLLQNTIPRITNATVSETLALINLGVVGARVTISFSVESVAERISYRHRFGAGAWVIGETYDRTIVFDTEETGKLEIEATPVYYASAGPKYKTSTNIFGKTLPPSDVQNLGISITGGLAYLTFDAPTDLDVTIGGRIHLRHASATTGANWNNATELLTAPVPGNTQLVPLMAGTYLAKWVDSLGNESTNAALVVTTVTSELLSLNVVGTINDGPTWPGTIDDTVIDPTLGGVKLIGAATIDGQTDDIDLWAAIDTLGGMISSGTYTLNSSIDLGVVATSRLSSSMDLMTFSATNLIDAIPMIDDWPNVDEDGDPVDSRLDMIDDWLDVDGIDLSSAGAWFEISTSDDNVTWTPWQKLVAGDATFRSIRARMWLYTTLSYINVMVRSGSINVDMPDRVQDGNDVACPAATLSVTFPTRFQAMPSLAISGQAMATGDYFTISNKSLTGFDIIFKNAAGTPVARTFDWIAKGY